MPAWIDPFIILILIGVNGALALSEIAIVSVNEGRLETAAEEGSTAAQLALQLSQDPSRFLSTVQVGITLVGIINGAFGGASLARRITPFFEGLPVVGAFAQTAAIGLVVVVTTYLTLVFGELVPKRLAMSNPEGWAKTLAPIMQSLSVVSGPIVKILSTSTDATLRLLGVSPDVEEEITEADVRFMMRRGAQEGVFNTRERDMIEQVFTLDERRVATIMTPNLDVVWLDPDDALDSTMGTIVATGFSAYPVGDIDDVQGMLSTKILLAQLAAGRTIDLKAATHNPLLIPEGTRALRALDLFKQSGEHAALVVDEYGSIQGIVTLSDFMKELAVYGDQSDPMITKRSDGSYLVDGTLPIEELADLFATFEPRPEADRSYQTVGGLLMEQLGRIPRAGDIITVQGLRLEVMDMDGHRVDTVLVTT